MNRFLLPLNVLLLVAVGYLYYLHFSAPSAAEYGELPPSARSGEILFLNSDSLIEQYAYYKERRSDLEKRSDQLKAELKSASDKLERDVEEYQRNAPSMTQSQRQQTEESLMMRQQQLVQRKEDGLSKLDDEHSRYSDSLYSRLSAYLKDFSKGKGLHYVLGYQRGGGILFANDSLDITKSVIDAMNSRYEEEKE
jgi:outer membrane protein